MTVRKSSTLPDGRPDPEVDLGSFRSLNWFLARAFEQNLDALKENIDGREREAESSRRGGE
ncbi:hypothetical protein ACQUFY_21600 [Robbsia andropogonis]|uniref:hypothetical protein n=1 Tax=Robbsia andropogonis TaxID=28092 RepID=UPI003D2271A9